MRMYVLEQPSKLGLRVVYVVFQLNFIGDMHNVTNNVIIDPLFPVLFWKMGYENSEKVGEKDEITIHSFIEILCTFLIH